MAWTTPITASANSTFTAAQWNAGVRDNLAVTAPGISTTSGRIIVTGAANQVVERAVVSDYVDASEATATTTYVDLATAGPAVTVDTSANCLIFQSMEIANSGASDHSLGTFAVSGATTLAASDARALYIQGQSGKSDRIGITNGFTTLTAGSNIFTSKYRAAASTATFARRRLVVMGL